MEPTTRRARRPARAAWLFLAVGLVLDCSKHSPTAPLTSANPGGGGGFVVRGTVTDTTGAPVTNAVVSLNPSSGPTLQASKLLQGARGETAPARGGSAPSRGASATSEGSTTAGNATSASPGSTPTDSQGRFAFTGVTAGDYVVSAIAANHLGDSKPVSISAATSADTIVVLLKLRQTASVKGKVLLDGTTDFRGTVVYAEGTSSVALTGGTGDYELLDVPLGSWTITASHAGYLDHSDPVDLTSEGQVVTLSNVTLLRDLNLPPTAAITVEDTCGLFPITLDATASDPDGSIARYEWDFEDDGSIDTSGASLVSIAHVYALGTHRAKLVVTDDHGARGVAVTTFTVADAETLYVSSTTGSPSGTGSRASPFSTLAYALATASANTHACPTVILVALGFYPEAVDLPSGVRVRGGFDPSDWQQLPGQRTSVWVGSSLIVADHTRDIEVSDMEFVAADPLNLGASSIVLGCRSVDASVRFVRCRFAAGKGQVGAAGGAGSKGSDGFAGYDASGQTAGQFPIIWPPTLPRGADGSNGPSSGAVATAGFPGTTGCGTHGAGGTAGTSALCAGAPTNGGTGGNGGPGTDGTPGAGQTLIGQVSGFDWIPTVGGLGGFGCDGGGSGGGGAGGATCSQPGGGGGSGATGGRGGGAGGGGKGGGASIAALLLDSSPVFSDCVFVTAGGGNGGVGGDGGAGGAGQNGGLGGTTGASRGGDGGASGRGGHGGGGQGGAGGPSWCILDFGTSSPTVTSASYSPGPGGTGGLGGRLGGTGARAASGVDAPSAAIGP